MATTIPKRESGAAFEVASDAELIAVLLGGPGDVESIGEALLEALGGLRGLARAPLLSMTRVRGVSTRRAERIKASLELGYRFANEPRGERVRFSTSAEVYEFVRRELRDLPQEVFEIILVDARNRLSGRSRVTVGTLTGSLVHPREVFRDAIGASAAAVILVHNHPSGDPAPSPEDFAITERLVAAGEILGIRVLDHVIVGDDGYVSMADLGEVAAASRDGDGKWRERV